MLEMHLLQDFNKCVFEDDGDSWKLADPLKLQGRSEDRRCFLTLGRDEIEFIWSNVRRARLRSSNKAFAPSARSLELHHFGKVKVAGLLSEREIMQGSGLVSKQGFYFFSA